MVKRLRRLEADESGQALIYVALMMAVLVTVIFAVFDLGRLMSAKIRSQNAADAAALAAVSLKVGVHHTRSLAYLAMTEEGIRARVELINALASFGQEGVFNAHLRKANAHVDKILRLQKGLVAYNQWIDQAGPAMVADAARLGYAANIQGMNAHLSSGAALDAENLRAIDAPGALRENGNHGAQTLGGVIYPKEGLGKGKDAGKTFVEVVPKFQGFDYAIFGFGPKSGAIDVPAWASAGYVSADAISSDPAAKGSGLKLNTPFGNFGLNWYSPRLVRTGQKNQGSFGSPGAGGHIVSEH